MGFMFFPQPEKAAKHLYRVAKPGGKCYITSWKQVGYTDIAFRVIKALRGDQGTYDIPLVLWKKEMEDLDYLVSELTSAGFKDCTAENIVSYSVQPGMEGLKFMAASLPKHYEKFMKFKEGEEEKWLGIWEEEVAKEFSNGAVRIKMIANIASGTK
jgi:ubiquinone/menaquinone biosynthesis C-methylase UbiE